VRKSIVLLILAALFFSGCGYTTRTLLPEHIKTIYVDNVRNKIDITKETEYRDTYFIYRPGLERALTREIKDRFIFDGKLNVINNSARADSVLKCEIIDFEKEPLQYADDRTVDEYRLKIIVNMQFTDLVEGATLIDEKGFVGETAYTLSGAFASTESSAQDSAVTDLARRIVERVVDIW